jgi:hypothetical protein
MFNGIYFAQKMVKKHEESTKLYEKEAHKSRRNAEEAEMYKRQVEDLRKTQVSDTTEQQLIQSYEVKFHFPFN